MILRVELPFTMDKVNQINELTRIDNLTLVFNNTRGLNSTIIRNLDEKIRISVVGGLKSKKKYDNNLYKKRTYYSSKELALIIEKYERIERGINHLWSPLEKVMFIYKSICEYSNYEINEYNGRDASRNLLGMITGKSVCSGYALIFKEAMDRIGVDCIYQNREGHHSWNIIKIDGNYYAAELTWDIYNKRNNMCGFMCFAREDQKSFYETEGHNISRETEEQEYNLSIIPENVLRKSLTKISQKRINIIGAITDNGVEQTTFGDKRIIIQNNAPYICSMPNCTYMRSDGSSFAVFPTGNRGNGVIEYFYLEYREQEKKIHLTRLYSEIDLVVDDKIMRMNIANNLMSRERINSKINEFNGYLGYVVNGNSSRFYHEKFEQDIIHKYR